MFDADLIQPLMRGARVTIQLTFLAALLGTAMSILSGLVSLSPFAPLRAVNRVYVDFFRGTSAIVQLFWIFYALPLVGPSLSPLMAGVVTLGLNMGSYGSEVVRGALLAVPAGQSEATVALNLTGFQRMRYVIFPQAVVAMLPPYGNLLIELFKGTALVSLITLSDLTFAGQQLRVFGAQSTTVIFTAVLIGYFLMALVITQLVRLAEIVVSRGLETGRGARRVT
ncbi:MAG: ectoine/hydroxyectoine ABC transporter permease subunit EhuC [Dehalococcoidia bacterium]|nr:ectoine/hydroxyectoine ABC transporter permease subunit EhuC [Dehalococcoidia bacterium]